MNRKSFLVLGLLATVGGLLPACSPSLDSTHVSHPPSPSIVRRGTLEDRFLLTGELRAVKSRRLIVPQTPEWTVKIQWLGADGSRVRAGDPVVQLDNSSILAKLEEQRLAVREAEEQLQKIHADTELDRAKKTLEVLRCRTERDKARLEAEIPESLRSRREDQEKQLVLEKAEAALEKAARELESLDRIGEIPVQIAGIKRDMARRDLERAESSLALLTLTAPEDGVLVVGLDSQFGHKWQVGDSARPGQILAEIPDLSEMQVEAWLSDVDDGQVLPNMSVRCRLDAHPEQVFSGRVDWIGSVASGKGNFSNRRFFPVRIALAQANPEFMRPGMSVQVEVIRAHREDALLVPITSLRFRGPDSLVILNNGRGLKAAIAECSALDCALTQGPPEGTALGEAR